MTSRILRGHSIFAAVLVVGLCAASFAILVSGYAAPDRLLWDEKYHVPHAQRYLHGVFFLEPHPPLGKLLVALGEWLVDADSSDARFVAQESAGEGTVAMRGYRLVPIVCAWLSVLLLFVCIWMISGRIVYAGLVTPLFFLDNALVLHLRSANLESMQIFFFLASICIALGTLVCPRGWHCARGMLWGASAAGAVMVKYNAAILAVFIPFLWRRLGSEHRGRQRFFLSGMCAAGLVVLLVFYVHMLSTYRIESRLPGGGLFGASISEGVISDGDSIQKLLAIPALISSSARYFLAYQAGVPELNLCQADEHGSPVAWLPFGGRVIPYLEESEGDLVRYLILVANPVVWGAAFFGVVLATVLSLAGLFGISKDELDPAPLHSLVLCFWAYVVLLANAGRVLYLYHYFLALVLGLILVPFVIQSIPAIGRLIMSDRIRVGVLLFLLAAAGCVFLYLSPFTYGVPLARADVEARAFFSWWDLRCRGCGHTNQVARPLCDPRVKQFPNVSISGLRAEVAFQEFGDPVTNAHITGQSLVHDGRPVVGIGVHANSAIRFRLAGRYSWFHGMALPGPASEAIVGMKGSVEFKIFVDGREAWSSGVIRSGEVARRVEISVRDAQLLELIVSDAGDGNENDFAAWAQPSLGP